MQFVKKYSKQHKFLYSVTALTQTGTLNLYCFIYSMYYSCIIGLNFRLVQFYFILVNKMHK